MDLACGNTPECGYMAECPDCYCCDDCCRCDVICPHCGMAWEDCWCDDTEMPT